MLIYFLVFAIAFIYYKTTENTPSVHSYIPLALFFSYLAIFIGLGDMIGGYDRYIYGEIFDSIADSTRGDHNYSSLLILVNGDEYGYFIFQILISYITANRYIFIFICSILMYVLYYRAFRLYINNYPIACFLFLGLFYYFTITYIRQTIAVGIIWQSVRYIWLRKPIPFFSLVIIAYSFHNSALIFLPMYFVPIKKFTQQQILWFLSICLILSLTPLPSFLISSAGDATGMEGRTNIYASNEMQGFRWDYLMEVAFFIWIFLSNHHLISKKKKEIVFFNISIIFCAILLFFIRFGQGGRFGWYYLIGLIYMLTRLTTRPKALSWMKPLVIAISFLLFARITFLWAFNLTPYKTFLTNGLPSGEYYIYEEYEYDIHYTHNKFYR